MREIFFVRGRAKLGFTVFYANSFTKENENRKRKRSLGCARDDETRKCLFPFLFIPRKPTSALTPKGEASHYGATNFLNLIALPCGAVYPPPSVRPFFKGLLSCHVKAPLVKTTKREYPHIVISSGARNLPCTPVKQREWDDDKQNTPGDASDNDTKTLLSHHFSSPRLEPLSSLC